MSTHVFRHNLAGDIVGTAWECRHGYHPDECPYYTHEKGDCDGRTEVREVRDAARADHRQR